MSTNLATLVEECEHDYRQVVVQLAQGIEVDPADALRIAAQAGRSAHDLQRDVSTVEERVGAQRTTQENSRDYEASEVATLKEASLAAHQALSDTQAEISRLETIVVERHDNYRIAVRKVNATRDEIRHKRREAEQLLQETAGAGSDPHDPANFRSSIAE